MISIITHSYYLTPWGCRDLDTTVDSIEYIYLFKKWRPMRSELTIDTAAGTGTFICCVPPISIALVITTPGAFPACKPNARLEFVTLGLL